MRPLPALDAAPHKKEYLLITVQDKLVVQKTKRIQQYCAIAKYSGTISTVINYTED
jgi:hypothetical protein